MFSFKPKIHFFLSYLILACLCSASSASAAKINYREKERQFLDQLLEHGKYDARIRPSGVNGSDGPVNVRVSMFVRRISKVDDVNMDYNVELTFRAIWMDERLKFDNMEGHVPFLTLTETNRIWMPDLFLSNEKDSHLHNTFVPNFYIKIYPTGELTYNLRLSLTMACSMNFKLFPFDRQNCDLRLSSYARTANDMEPVWRDEDAVQMAENLEFRGFTLNNFTFDSCVSKNHAYKFGCIKVNFLFQRASLHYLIYYYAPCFVLVLASFVSFWLDQEAVAARVSLGVATLLTMVMVIVASNINGSWPMVSYIKAVDIWTMVCLMLIFGTLLEFATVNYTSRLDMQSKYEDGDSSVNQPNDIKMSEMGKKTWIARYKYCPVWVSKFSRSNIIDIISRITFPLAFFLFNLAYWITYLTSDEQ